MPDRIEGAYRIYHDRASDSDIADRHQRSVGLRVEHADDVGTCRDHRAVAPHRVMLILDPDAKLGAGPFTGPAHHIIQFPERVGLHAAPFDAYGLSTEQHVAFGHLVQWA